VPEEVEVIPEPLPANEPKPVYDPKPVVEPKPVYEPKSVFETKSVYQMKPDLESKVVFEAKPMFELQYEQRNEMLFEPRNEISYMGSQGPFGHSLCTTPKYTEVEDLRIHMKESWLSIDELLVQVCATDDKNEKTRMLNMIGAQRARIFIRMGHIAEKIDVTPFKGRSHSLFKILDGTLTFLQKEKMREIMTRHIKRSMTPYE